jgi:hypothetical protein
MPDDLLARSLADISGIGSGSGRRPAWSTTTPGYTLVSPNPPSNSRPVNPPLSCPVRQANPATERKD